MVNQNKFFISLLADENWKAHCQKRGDVGYQGTGGIRTVLVDWEDGAGFCLANQRMKWSKNKALDCWLMLPFFLP